MLVIFYSNLRNQYFKASNHTMSYCMIPKVKELKLIAMYLYISDVCKYDLLYSCQRFSNNSKPEFTDEEVMTIYLYAMHIEQRFKVKQMTRPDFCLQFCC